MKFLFLVFVFVSLSVFYSSESKSQTVNVCNILTQTFDKISKLSTLKYTFVNYERIDGVLLNGKIKVKLQVEPKKIYALLEKPSKGTQLLYIEGQNQEKVLFAPNSFPYINLNLDPYGTLMRDKNHHTIHNVGFEQISKILSNTYKLYPNDFKYIGDTVWKGRDCYIINAEFRDYKIVDYKLLANQNIMDVARIKYLNEYKILELNKLTDYYFSKENYTLKIPNIYAKKFIMYIDKKNLLPIFQKIYDEKGLFEQYEFINVEVNPIINSVEFTEKFLDEI